MNRSLRSRLMIGLAATIVAGFAVAAVMVFVLMRASLMNEFDALLGSKARALATLIEQTGNEIDIEFIEHPMQEFARKIRPEYYQLWDETGRVLAKSRRLGDDNLQQAAGSLAAPGHQFATLPDGRPGRQVAVQFLPAVEDESLEQEDEADDEDDDDFDKIDFRGRQRVTLVVARETAEIDQALARLGWLMFAVSATVIATTLGVIAWLVKRSLNPLDALAKQIAELDEEELTTRFQVNDAPSELDPVITQLNELLARLEETFQRERLFSADVAHELRTPLAGLRSTLEVALSKDRNNAEYRQSLQDCEEISVDTHRLVETLLSLAKIESGQATIDGGIVDIPAMIKESWKPLRSKAMENKLQVSFSGLAEVLIKTDANKLRVVLSNLLRNAVDYTELAGKMEVRWAAFDETLRLTFSNSGCKLSEEQTRRVFDRFWQADAARSATGSHAGLGLALCRKIVHMLGGAITAETRDASFIVTIELTPEFVDPSNWDSEVQKRGAEWMNQMAESGPSS